MAPGSRLRLQRRTKVSRSGRESKKSTKMADVTPEGRDTCCKRKTKETQQSCKKIKVEKNMEDDECKGWACCMDDNEIKVKHEPLEVECREDYSDSSHDVCITGDKDQKHTGEEDQKDTGEEDQKHTREEDQKHTGEEDQKDTGEEDQKGPLFIDINSMTMMNETFNSNQMMIGAPQHLKHSRGTQGSHSAPEASSTHSPSGEKIVGTLPMLQAISKNIATINSACGLSSQPSNVARPPTALIHDEIYETLDDYDSLSDLDDTDSDVDYLQGTENSDTSSDSDARDYESSGGMSRRNGHAVCRKASSPDQHGYVGGRTHVHCVDTTDALLWDNCNNFVPQIPAFQDADVGVTDIFPYTGENMCEMDYFRAYFDQTLMEHIVHETNRWANKFVETVVLRHYSRMMRWKDTTVAEMYVFLALCMMMKHCVKQSIQDYWNKDAAVPTPLMAKYMSRDRFFLLVLCIHFENYENEKPEDRMWKVRHILSELNGKFRDFFVPGQKVMIDESLMLFRERVAFRKYIPSKCHRFGLKFFVLCDCETGMVIDTILYSGTDVDIPSRDVHGFSGSVVKTLMSPLLNQGHILYTDNYYTCPRLTKFLLQHKTAVCGTVNAYREGMPVFGAYSADGECELKTNDNMLALRWTNGLSVHMLTTIHTGEMVDSGEICHRTKKRIFKPDCVLDYNINMRLIDKCDIMVGAVECVRKNVMRTKKMFFHLVDVTMLNSYNMYMVKTGKRLTMRTFSHHVLTQLLVKYGEEVAVHAIRGAPSKSHTTLTRLLHKESIALHQLETLPGTNKRAVGQRHCYVCRNTVRREQKRKMCRYRCKECLVALCPTQCFVDYHTRVHF